MLKINNLTVKAGEKEILHNFDLEIENGSTHVLMGPNGVGKSTICRAILKDPNYQITEGNVSYNNKDITNLSTTEISREGLMLISQSPIAIEGVTNAEMLRMALGEKTGERVDIFKFSKEAKKICEKIKLPESFLHRDINSGMSGGERKKNDLLHVWMLKPSFLLLDEIDSGLDVDALKIVASSIKEYQEEYNCSILIVTHNPKLLEIIKPDKVHKIKNKKIIKTGGMELSNEIEQYGFDNVNETNEIEKN